MRRLPVFVLLFCTTLAGCNGTGDEAAPDAPAADTAASDTSADDSSSNSSAVDEVPIELTDWDGLQAMIDEQQGNVVVVDVWSTWCTPCIEEFPGLVELHKQYDEQVNCFSLNCNFTGADGEKPEDARPEIEKFLQEQGATFVNVISTLPDRELMDKVGAAAVPVVLVYDKQGELKKKFTNEEGEYGEDGFTYEQHIQPLVAELLAE